MTADRDRPAARRVDRLLGLFTLVVAVAWGAGAIAVADYVRGINSARVVGALMAGGLAFHAPLPGGSVDPRPPSGASDGAPAAAPPPTQDIIMSRNAAFVETVADLWLRVMLGTAGVVGVLGLLAARVRRPRPLHVLTAACLLACAATTLAGMRLLVDPDYGGLPPLPFVSYLCVGLVLSVHACVLLAAVGWTGRRGAGGSPGTAPLDPLDSF